MWNSLGESTVEGKVLRVLEPSWTIEGPSKCLCSISEFLEGITRDLDQSRIDLNYLDQSIFLKEEQPHLVYRATPTFKKVILAFIFFIKSVETSPAGDTRWIGTTVRDTGSIDP